MRFVPSSCYLFLVDTPTYAGSFEREMCAHVTGQIGDCEVGREYAEEFRAECPQEYAALDRLIERQPDEHGNYRPVSIYATPGFWNDGMGTAWPDSSWGTQETIDTYRQSLRDAQKRGSLKELDADTAMPDRHPSYQSVAIFFHATVPENLLKFMAERVKTYKDKWGNGPDKVLAIRFVHERIIPQLDERWADPSIVVKQHVERTL